MTLRAAYKPNHWLDQQTDSALESIARTLFEQEQPSGFKLGLAWVIWACARGVLRTLAYLAKLIATAFVSVFYVAPRIIVRGFQALFVEFRWTKRLNRALRDLKPLGDLTLLGHPYLSAGLILGTCAFYIPKLDSAMEDGLIEVGKALTDTVFPAFDQGLKILFSSSPLVTALVSVGIFLTAVLGVRLLGRSLVQEEILLETPEIKSSLAFMNQGEKTYYSVPAQLPKNTPIEQAKLDIIDLLRNERDLNVLSGKINKYICAFETGDEWIALSSRVRGLILLPLSNDNDPDIEKLITDFEEYRWPYSNII